MMLTGGGPLPIIWAEALPPKQSGAAIPKNAVATQENKRAGTANRRGAPRYSLPAAEQGIAVPTARDPTSPKTHRGGRLGLSPAGAASAAGPQTITSTARRPRVRSLRGRNWRGRSLLITLQVAAIALQTLENCRRKSERPTRFRPNSAATPELAGREPKNACSLRARLAIERGWSDAN
jgi:hypothetical protein